MPGTGPGRGLYRATNGDLYGVVGDTVYYVQPDGVHVALGQIQPRSNPVSFADNGQHAGNDIVMVDGSPTGYKIDMTTRVMTPVVDPTGSFRGADFVRYLQTFFIFNVPNTPFFIVSLADRVEFDPLDIAAKVSYADNISAIEIRQRELWLIGDLTTEPWFLSGAFDFQFEAIPSTFVPHGCIAKYSEAFADVNIFWLARNLQGNGIAVKSNGYKADRISNHALEQEWQKYPTMTNAVGGVYQINGHTFWVLHFPSAENGRGKSWAYDLSTEAKDANGGGIAGNWHQLAWSDANGNLCRHRASFYANAYNMILGQDWQNGNLYRIDPEVNTDDGHPILRVRGFPHVLDELKRVTHNALVTDMECGTSLNPADDPQLNLTFSDDRGKSWSNPMQRPLGKTGKFTESPIFPRLGMARDRVYELSWSADMKTALNAVYIDPEEADS